MRPVSLVLCGTLLTFTSCVHIPRVAMPQRHTPIKRPTLELAVAIPREIEAHAQRAVIVAPPKPKEKVEAVIVVALDGVRWQEIFEGTGELHERDARVPVQDPEQLVPNLSRWATEQGSSVGAPGFGAMRATGPDYLSLPGYTEIMTGRPPKDCQSNFCGAVKIPTMLDQAKEAYPDEHVAVVSSWERIAYAASPTLEGIDFSSGRMRANGVPDLWLREARRYPSWPGEGEYRADAFTMPVALNVLKKERPKLMFIGLGDTDEHAHHGDIPSYVGALRAADAFLGRLEDTLADMGERGHRTAIFVTCDHGRNADFREHGGEWPESGRVWLVATGAGIAVEGKVDTHDVHLADLAPTVRELLDLPTDEDESAGKPMDAILER